MKTKKLQLAAVPVIISLLSGCGIGSSVDSLLSPPMLSDEQDEIYSALTEASGNDISLVYPRSGEYRSAFVFYDLDGDGSDEAIVFYKNESDSESSVRVNILDNENGWRSVYDHAGAGSTIEQVFFTDLGGRGRVSMAIGYGYITPTEKTLRLYSFGGGMLNNEYSDTYYKTICMDLDGDGGQDIAVINCNNENHSAYISLVTDRGNGAQCTSTIDLSPNTADLSGIIGGYIGNNTPAVFIDGLMGSGYLSTEIIYCVNGQLRNPANLPGSDISALTARNQGLYSCDIDGDGVIEIPLREPFPGYGDSGNAQYITSWNSFENYTIVKKYSSLTEADKGYAFMLPEKWEGSVTVKSDGITGEKVFYKFNRSLTESRIELMRILVCDKNTAAKKSLAGYVTAASENGVVYMIKFGDTEDELQLTVAEARNNFHIWGSL